MKDGVYVYSGDGGPPGAAVLSIVPKPTDALPLNGGSEYSLVCTRVKGRPKDGAPCGRERGTRIVGYSVRVSPEGYIFSKQMSPYTFATIGHIIYLRKVYYIIYSVREVYVA